LRAHRPGETVAVVVVRGGERITVNVALEVRK
jgi:S1-C subfamily serine protease